MRAQRNPSGTARAERGSTLYIVAASLVALLLLGGLAIDLGWMYVGRTEAQRAADAAALAGAQQFVQSTFTTGGISQAAVTTLADNAAVSTAQQNKVGGQALQTSDVTAGPPDFSRPGNPLITVTVSKPIPTFFMRVVGRNSVTVGATATAEAYDPRTTGTGPTFCASCLKPFLVPNCDPNHAAPANGICPGQGLFINGDGTTANSGVFPSGVVGESWTLHSNAAPSQWYEIAFDGSQSGNNFRQDVEKCDTNPINCGTQLQTLDGKKVGPNGDAICTLITYGTAKCNGAATATSVDTISFSAAGSPPYTITAGAGNPYFSAGTRIGQSASMVTVPVYDGHSLNPGKDTVTVVGYMQMFITGFQHQGNDDLISAMILGVSSCGISGGPGCGTAGSGTVAGGGASFIPVRLVQKP
jgi:Flp pilus assembly protein TadG